MEQHTKNMVLKLENTTTHQIFDYDVDDKNYGEKLYFRFDINTLELEDGEYSLTLYDGEDIVATDLLKVGDFNPQTLQYKTGDNTYISIELGAKLGSKYAQITDLNTTIFPNEGYDGMTDVVIDATPIYNNTKNEWYTKGKNDQKKLLSSIEIDTNGVYTNENGYDEVVVNVPDLNGAYDDGYSDGKTDGYNQGYAEGEKVSYDNGYSDGKESVASNARVIHVTENGNYLSEFSESIFPMATGYFDDGTPFYSYAKLSGIKVNTGIIPTQTTKVEFWYKPTSSKGYVWGVQNGGNADSVFKIWMSEGCYMETSIAGPRVDAQLTTDWYHIEMSFADGLFVNGVKMGDYPSNISTRHKLPIGINCLNSAGLNDYQNNGTFGMIKIDDTIIIPTKDGFLNYNTNTLLDKFQDGGYEYTEAAPIYGEGPLYKTINVNVIPKINIADLGLRFGYSNINKIPEWADWKGITDMSYMFFECNGLETISLIDTSNVTTMNNMFQSCSGLKTIPQLNTSKVDNMSNMFNDCGNLETIPELDTSNVTNMSYMFYLFGGIKKLHTLPKFNASKVNNMGNYFSYYADGMSGLVNVGGWEGLSCNWNDRYGLASCNNLSYQSCINILNGLADVTNLGGRTLKVHPNFLTAVGDEISIGTNKGWTITT